LISFKKIEFVLPKRRYLAADCTNACRADCTANDGLIENTMNQQRTMVVGGGARRDTPVSIS
jgi:hypothetical protein